MPRFPLIQEADAPDEVGQIYHGFQRKMGFPEVPNFIRTQGASPSMLAGTWGLVEHVLLEGSLPRSTKELIQVWTDLHQKPDLNAVSTLNLEYPDKGDILILGLKMTAVEEARHSDIQHAMIMAASLIILGSGALFFVFVIQNYYLVNRTLKQTQDYTRQVVASMANGLLSIDLNGKITS